MADEVLLPYLLFLREDKFLERGHTIDARHPCLVALLDGRYNNLSDTLGLNRTTLGELAV